MTGFDFILSAAAFSLLGYALCYLNYKVIKSAKLEESEQQSTMVNHG